MATEETREKWDFFVSYTQADKAWAEWIAWVLEEDGYRVLIQAWDFPPGSNWIQRMDVGIEKATRMIVVLSSDYLASVYGSAEWQAAWASDPDGTGRKLLPVRVADCNRPGLLAGIVGVDLFGLDAVAAKARLRGMVASALADRAKPAIAPYFPGILRAIRSEPQFPGIFQQVWNVPPSNPNFTGRAAELRKVARSLAAGSRVMVHSVHGMAGVGKSQLAIKYAYVHVNVHPPQPHVAVLVILCASGGLA